MYTICDAFLDGWVKVILLEIGQESSAIFSKSQESRSFFQVRLNMYSFMEKLTFYEKFLWSIIGTGQ